MSTGALVGFLFPVVSMCLNTMAWRWSASLTVMGISFISAYSVQYCSIKLRCRKPSLKQLIPVAFLTFILPVFGAVFGSTGHWSEVPFITAMGAIGGIVWSVPFVLWSSFRDLKASEQY